MKYFTLAEIDRTFYNILRLQLVSLGMLPDIVPFSSMPKAQGSAAYMEAKNNIGESLTEIFGVGSTEDRGENRPNKITVRRKSSVFGQLGGFPAKEFVETSADPKRWSKEFLPDGSRDITYEVRVITNRTSYDRDISEMIYGQLGMRRYLKSYSDYTTESGKQFLTTFEGDVDLSSAEVTERMFTFVARDVWIRQPRIIRTGIVPLTSVVWIPKLQGSEDALGEGESTDIPDLEVK